jgi:hypothetical protein
VGSRDQQQFIPADSLFVALSNIGRGRPTLLFILDCCYAGLMFEHLDAPNMAGNILKERKERGTLWHRSSIELYLQSWH